MRVTTMLCLLAGCCAAMMAAEPALMPLPVKVQAGQGTFAVNANFVVETVGGADARLAPAVAAFLSRVARQTGLLYAPVPPAAADARRLVIECAGGAGYPALGEDESYTLDVSGSEARIKAATADGAIHGLATFAQLIQPGAEGYQVAGVHIEDRPRFPWRGLMLDVCRHWMPIEVVKRNLDAMWAVKLNVLHWHLSEDQGFRVESKRYPRLQQLGSNGDYYRQDQVRDVVNYARDRGIRVVPEFDVPGHSGSWFPGYPELAPVAGPFTLGGRGNPSAMDPTKETTYSMLDGFIGEMSQLFPDPYYHIGGDEVNPREWNQAATIQSFAKDHGLKDAAAIQVYFNQRLLKIVQKYGKIMVGWDEILVPGLPTDAVIQSWRGQKSLAEAATKGYRGILSWGYYLDHLSPASFHYAVDPLGGPDAAGLSADQASHVMGGEACMWAEMVGPETVDSRVWPRTAAIAERLWSTKETTDVDSMYSRLETVSRNLEFTGIQHRAYYQTSIDRIAGSQPVAPVRLLADVTEAMGFGTGRTGRPTNTMPLNRFVDACQPESELAMALELAAKRFVARPGTDTADRALLRRNFEGWVANDALFQPLAQNNKLLAEVSPLSKDLAALGDAGIKLLDDLTPPAAPPSGTKPKKLSGKAKKAEEAAHQAALKARAEWLAKLNADITRLSQNPRRPAAGAPPLPDVRLAAYRPIKVLVESLK
ncbi:MAG TPA: family 20 glycosylhydrolase [Candidatus Sulfopaludibacter sp.]|jgi:hexosaminidase|nr:family 20 glycosylhydrolase [Candidatus Sulfopaludibacter sp.]